MASKKNLNISLDVDFLLNAKNVELDQAKIKAGVEREVNKTLNGLKVFGPKIEVSPEISSPPAVFAKYKKKLQAQANDYFQALNIKRSEEVVKGGVGFVDTQVASMRARGEKVSEEAIRLSKNVSERTLTQLSKVSNAVADLTIKQRQLFNVDKRTRELYAKSFNSGFVPTKKEHARLGKLASAVRELEQAQNALKPLTKSREYYDSKNDLVRQSAIELKELQAAASGVSGRLTHLNRVLNTTATTATKKREEDKEATTATKARTKAENEARAAAVLATRVYRQQPKSAADVSGRLRDAAEYKQYLERQRSGFTKVPGDSSDRKIGVVDRRLGKLGQRTAELKDFNTAVASSGTAVKKLGTNLSQTSLLFKQFFRFAIGYGVLYQMLGAVQALTSGVLDLDKAMFSIKAITAATTDQMTKIKSAIKEVAIETKFSTTEVAKAAQTLAQAGVEPGQINSVLSSVANFAAGTETSIAIAADLVSTMRNVFTELDDLTISNQLTKAVNISKLTGEDLKTILGISAQVVKRFNISSEQYLSAVTTLRNAGLKASTVATGLRQGLLEIFSLDTKSLDDFKQRYDEIGEDFTLDEIRSKFFQFTQEANPLVSVLRELKRLGFSGAGRKTLARSLDIRAANAVAAMVDNLEELEKAETKLTSGNAALDASATQMDSLSNSIDVLGAALTVLAADITEGPVAAFEDFVDAATEVIKVLDELHVESLAAGGEGLVPAMQLALAGGAAGATLPGSPAAKALRGVIGAGAGGAIGVGLAQGEDQELAADVANAALMASILVPLFSGLGGAARNGLAALKGKKRTLNKATDSTGTIFGFLVLVSGFIESIGGAFSSAASRIKKAGLGGLPALVGKVGVQALKFGSWVGLAVSIAWSLFKLFDDDSTLQKQKDRVDGLKRQAAKQNLKVEKITSSLSTFKGSDTSTGFTAASGSEAERVEKLQEAVSDYSFAYDKLFSGVDESRRAELEKLFVQLSTTAAVEQSPERLAILSEIEEDYGVSISNMDKANKAVFLKIVSGFSENAQALSAIADEYTQRLDAIYGRQNAGEKLTEIEKATLKSYENKAGAITRYRNALAGDFGGISQKEFLDLQSDLLKGIYDNGREFYNALDEEAAQVKAVTDQLDSAMSLITTSEALAPGEVQRIVRSLLAGARDTGSQSTGILQDMADKFTSVNDTLEVQKKQAQAALDRAEKEFNAASKQASSTNMTGLLNLFTGDAGRLDKATSRKAAMERRVKDLNTRTSELAPALGDIGAAQRSGQERSDIKTTSLKTNLLASAEFLVANRADIAEKMATELVTNDSVAKMFDLVITAAANRGIKASGLVGEQLSTGAAEGGLKPTKLGDDLITLVDNYKTLISKTAAGAKEGGGPVVRKYVRTSEVHDTLANLELEIEKAQKDNLKSLIDLNDVTNPLVRQRELLLKENAKALEVEQGNLASISKAYEDGVHHQKDKNSRDAKTNAAEIRISNLNRERTKIAAKAKSVQFAAITTLDKKELAVRKRALAAKLKEVESGITSAVAKEDETALVTLQAERVVVREDLLAVENRSFSLNQQGSDLDEDILALKQKQLSNELAAASAEEQIAITNKRLKFAKGGFTTFSDKGDAYQRAADIPIPRAERAQSLGIQLDQTKSERTRISGLLQESNSKEDIEKYTQKLADMDASIASLTGEYEVLTRDIAYRGNPNSLVVALERLNSASSNLADNMQNNFVSAIDSIGDAFADALFEGENFGEMLENIFLNLAKKQVDDSVSALITDIAIGFAKSSNSSSFEGPPENTKATGATNIKVTNFNGGGIISGPGTGTSDSIPGVAVSKNGKINARIMVSDGESILTAKATEQLGADFINKINAGAPVLRYASGRVGVVANPSDKSVNSLRSSKPQEVPVINFSNEGTPKTADSAEVSFDGERMILDIVTKDIRKGGGLDETLQGLYGVNRGGR